MFDANRSGTIDVQEFSQLYSYINTWKEKMLPIFFFLVLYYDFNLPFQLSIHICMQILFNFYQFLNYLHIFQNSASCKIRILLHFYHSSIFLHITLTKYLLIKILIIFNVKLMTKDGF